MRRSFENRRSKPGRSADPRDRATRRDHRPPPLSGDAGWDHVAAWYDRLVGDSGSDYQQNVIIPAALRMLAPQRNERFIDICCGQGVFCRALAAAGAEFVLGVDASEKLIAAARQRGPRDIRIKSKKKTGHPAGEIRYEIADARRLGALADGTFDGAACLMAIQDVDGVAAVFRGMAAALRNGGRAVVIMMHPCFRVPRQSDWGWDDAKKTQYRRIDRYATPMTIPIATHPGRDPDVQTVFHHRPLADYINALGAAGLALVGAEELYSHRHSTAGGKARGENRAAAEIPVFFAMRTEKR